MIMSLKKICVLLICAEIISTTAKSSQAGPAKVAQTQDPLTNAQQNRAQAASDLGVAELAVSAAEKELSRVKTEEEGTLRAQKDDDDIDAEAIDESEQTKKAKKRLAEAEGQLTEKRRLHDEADALVVLLQKGVNKPEPLKANTSIAKQQESAARPQANARSLGSSAAAVNTPTPTSAWLESVTSPASKENKAPVVSQKKEEAPPANTTTSGPIALFAQGRGRPKTPDSSSKPSPREKPISASWPGSPELPDNRTPFIPLATNAKIPSPATSPGREEAAGTAQMPPGPTQQKASSTKIVEEIAVPKPDNDPSVTPAAPSKGIAAASAPEDKSVAVLTRSLEAQTLPQAKSSAQPLARGLSPIAPRGGASERTEIFFNADQNKAQSVNDLLGRRKVLPPLDSQQASETLPPKPVASSSTQITNEQSPSYLPTQSAQITGAPLKRGDKEVDYPEAGISRLFEESLRPNTPAAQAKEAIEESSRSPSSLTSATNVPTPVTEAALAIQHDSSSSPSMVAIGHVKLSKEEQAARNEQLQTVGKRRTATMLAQIDREEEAANSEKLRRFAEEVEEAALVFQEKLNSQKKPLPALTPFVFNTAPYDFGAQNPPALFKFTAGQAQQSLTASTQTGTQTAEEFAALETKLQEAEARTATAQERQFELEAQVEEQRRAVEEAQSAHSSALAVKQAKLAGLEKTLAETEESLKITLEATSAANAAKFKAGALQKKAAEKLNERMSSMASTELIIPEGFLNEAESIPSDQKTPPGAPAVSAEKIEAHQKLVDEHAQYMKKLADVHTKLEEAKKSALSRARSKIPFAGGVIKNLEQQRASIIKKMSKNELYKTEPKIGKASKP